MALVDIGGGTTDIAIFVDGAIKHTSVLSLGGNHLTNDIAVGLRTPMAGGGEDQAEIRLLPDLHGRQGRDHRGALVGGREPRVLSRQLLAEILEPRVEEIFTLVNREMVKCGFEDLIASGVVLTGGTAILPGMPELAEQIFNLPVRRGVPQDIGGLVDVVNSPVYATGVGLVMYGSRNHGDQEFQPRPGERFFDRGHATDEGMVRRIFLIKRSKSAYLRINSRSGRGESPRSAPFTDKGEGSMFEFDDSIDQMAKIKVIGVGGGGGNAVNTMIDCRARGR